MTERQTHHSEYNAGPQEKKRRVHVAAPLSAHEILDRLGVTQKDRRIAHEAIEKVLGGGQAGRSKKTK